MLSIRKGNRPQIAAAAAGLPINTYYQWIRQGKAGDPHLYQFALDVEQAMAMAEVAAISTIAGKEGDFVFEPENAKWWLDRARPDGYSKEVATKVNALLNEFMNRLEQNLPTVITKEMIGLSPFELVIGASSGQELRLGSGHQEDT